MSFPVSPTNAPHYVWGGVCDGWRLVDREDLSVIEERVPPSCSEKRHYHQTARQFFYILEGEAVIEIEGIEHALHAGQGIEILPTQRHQFTNRATKDVRFIVTSAPSTRHDRCEV